MSVGICVLEELYQKAVEIAEAQDLSVDEVFASAFVEQVAAWERLQQRASPGSREKFLTVLDNVPETSNRRILTGGDGGEFSMPARA